MAVKPNVISVDVTSLANQVLKFTKPVELVSLIAWVSANSTITITLNSASISNLSTSWTQNRFTLRMAATTSLVIPLYNVVVQSFIVSQNVISNGSYTLFFNDK